MIHGSTESYAVDDSRIITDGSDFFRASLNYGKPLPAKVRDGAMFPVFGSNGEVGKHSFPLVEKPGLIIGRKGSFGEVHISKEPFFPIDTTYYVDSFHGQPIRYWLYQLRYLPLKQLNRATAIPGLNREDAYSQVIALPALAEQKVIAQKLDTLLAQVEKTKAHLERITQILKCFRQSVLSEAVAGRLTEEWRKENFPKLSSEEFNKEIKQYRFEKWIYEQEEKFEAKGKRPVNKTWKEKYTEAKIDEKIVRRELPQGWIYQPLDGLIYISARVGWKGLKASEYTNDGPLFLSVHSLNYGRTVELSEAFHISHERYNESPEIILKNDDILLCKDGAGIGKIGIVKDLDHPATINSSLLLIRPGKYFVPEYLYFFLAGPSMQRIVQERMTGSAVPHLFQRDVKEFVLEIPPLEEQTEIVKRVEELFAFADNIDQKANTALGRVNNLTHTILAKAFRGELTAEWRTENLDLISGVNSAEALLAKIKAERETLKKQPKPKRNVRGKRIGSSMSKQIIKVTEALKQAGTSLSGQQLLEAAGYPSDSNIEELEKFFLDIREALSRDKSIVKIERSEDGQDWFSLAEADTNE